MRKLLLIVVLLLVPFASAKPWYYNSEYVVVDVKLYPPSNVKINFIAIAVPGISTVNVTPC